MSVSRISAVIITLNESLNIGRCLASVAGVADEVVVVDSFSTDNTVEICREFGAKVIQREWEGYSKTKNFANQKAQHSYIFSLDADEELSQQLKRSILSEKAKGLSGVYEINRLTSYCGKWIRHGGWYPDRKVRLFPKDKAHWEGEVHEKLVYDHVLKRQQLKGDLFHYSYSSREEFELRSRRYAELAAKAYQSKGKSGNNVKAAASAAFRFFKMYVLQAGFLDGKEGFEIASVSAKMNWKKYSAHSI